MRAFYGSRYPTQPELAAAKAREDGERTKLDILRDLIAKGGIYSQDKRIRDLAESIASAENRAQKGTPFRTARDLYAAGYTVFLREYQQVNR